MKPGNGTREQNVDATVPRHQSVSRSATLAYDEITKQVVLFGGSFTGYHFYGDTWTYNGVNWVQQQPTSSTWLFRASLRTIPNRSPIAAARPIADN